jgi:hypothetical protein
MYPVFSRIFGVSPQFNDYGSDQEKLAIVFSNPAVLKVFKLQCDMFSLGKIYVYQGDDEVKDDPILKLFEQPNNYQPRSQWLWDYMFWVMTGNARLYVHSDIPTPDNKLFFLDPTKATFPRSLEDRKDKMVFSKATQTEIGKTIIEYRYDDGEILKIPLSKIDTFTDLTNGTGNWFKGNSCIDALHKIISNSEAALDANAINLEFARKFLVGGKADPKDVTKMPLSGDEQTSIESMVRGRKNVTGVKSLIEIKRFVENLKNLALDEAYLNQYYLIGSMYNIPRDVLEANLKGSTYENQEKARGGHVSYTLEPKGNALFEALSKRFGYLEAGKTICMSWDHLPFMQVFEADRAKTKNINVQTLNSLLKAGVTFDAANNFLDLGFKPNDYEKPKPEAKPNGGAGAAN